MEVENKEPVEVEFKQRSRIFRVSIIIPMIFSLIMLITSTSLIVNIISKMDASTIDRVNFNPKDAMIVFGLVMSAAAFGTYLFHPLFGCIKEFIGETTMEYASLLKNINYIIRSQIGLFCLLFLLFIAFLPVNGSGMINIPKLILFFLNLYYDYRLAMQVFLNEENYVESRLFNISSGIIKILTYFSLGHWINTLIYLLYKASFFSYLRGLFASFEDMSYEIRKRVKMQADCLLFNSYFILFFVIFFPGVFNIIPDKVYPVFVLLRKLCEKVLSQQIVKVVSNVL